MPVLLERSDTFADYPLTMSAEEFLRALSSARKSALLFDFDGTLAPFNIDPSAVRPWPGIPELLQRIQDSSRTHLAVVTGRPANEVGQLLSLRLPLDIWGLHGAERLHPDGKLERDELPAQDKRALVDARALLQSAQLPEGIRIENKWNAIVLHWRGISKRLSQAAGEYAENLMLPFVNNSGLRILPFDGGVELRSGHNKGDAIRMILEELPVDAPVAYLGDDATDEDAFQALLGRGFTVLVRPRWRPTNAHHWLRGPIQLQRFLAAWLAALRQ
ncbi:MAG: trehalose-phosphatase [Terracidiphilus sp.]|jgi:trehalose-phosphatase